MKVLIVFATNSGGTQLASDIVKENFIKNNHEAVVKEVRETNPDEFASFDLVILSSPSWDYEGLEGQPHPDYRPFMESSHGKKFVGKRFAVLGMGDSSYTYFCGAVDHLENFVKELGGTLIDKSLRIDGFYLDQTTNSQKVTDWSQALAQKLS